MSYYNTTKETGEQLSAFEGKTKTQDELLLSYFKSLPYGAELTRHELHKRVMSNAPVSSITRALANLKKAGKLERTGNKKTGDYGRPCFTWRLK